MRSSWKKMDLGINLMMQLKRKHLLPSRFFQEIFKSMFLSPFSTWAVQSISLLPRSPCWGAAVEGHSQNSAFGLKLHFPGCILGWEPPIRLRETLKEFPGTGGNSLRAAAGWGVRSSPGCLGVGMFSCADWNSSQLQLQVLLAQQSLVKYGTFPSAVCS